MIGITRTEYDEMTPSELTLCIDVFKEKEDSKVHKGMHEAWLSAYWHRVETLKPFNEYVNENTESKDNIMTDDQMLINVHSLNALFGGSVEKGDG